MDDAGAAFSAILESIKAREDGVLIASLVTVFVAVITAAVGYSMGYGSKGEYDNDESQKANDGDAKNPWDRSSRKGKVN
jgi:hypothetical protein